MVNYWHVPICLLQTLQAVNTFIFSVQYFKRNYAKKLMQSKLFLNFQRIMDCSCTTLNLQNLFCSRKGEGRIVSNVISLKLFLTITVYFLWFSFCQTDIIAMQHNYITKQLLYAYSDLYTNLHRFCERTNIFPSESYSPCDVTVISMPHQITGVTWI